MGLPYRIAIVGAGLIGSALAGHLVLAGNEATIGARRPDAFSPPDYQREAIDYPVRTIDEAILEARNALARDPANKMLIEMLSGTYRQKVDLLRRTTEMTRGS